MSVGYGAWLSALEILSFESSRDLARHLLGSSCDGLGLAARQTLDVFMSAGASDARVEAAVRRYIHDLDPADRHVVAELAEDFAYGWEKPKPIGWILLLRMIAKEQAPREVADPIGAGVAAWRDANVETWLAHTRAGGLGAWDSRYLAARGYPTTEEALDQVLQTCRSLLQVRAMEASWAAMISAGRGIGVDARDVVSIARVIGTSMGLPARQIRDPSLPKHTHASELGPS